MKTLGWMTLACTLALTACAEEENTPAVVTCVCAEAGCPSGQCDVRVTLAENCRGKLDSADVHINGTLAGQATVDAPFVSCEAFACDATVKLIVRSDANNFSTGEKDILTLLDPDVPVDCNNLP